MRITIFKSATPDTPQLAKFGVAVEVDREDLPSYIEQYAFSPSVFKNGSRSIANFVSADFIGLDVDGGLGLETAIQRLRSLNYNTHVSLSKSHGKEKNGTAADRFRILFPLKTTIQTVHSFAATWQSLHRLFPEADPACKNADRFFYPSKHYAWTPGKAFPVSESAPALAKTMPQVAVDMPPVIVLPKEVTYFLSRAATGLPGEFNASLNKAAFSSARAGLPEEMALALLQAASPADFDANDHKTFASGFKSGTAKGLLALPTPSGKPNVAEEVYMLIEERLNKDYLVVEDDQGRRGLFLKRGPGGVVRKVVKEHIASVAGTVVKESLGKFLDAAKCEKQVDNWIQYAPAYTDTIGLVTLKTSSGLAYHKVDVVPAPGAHPLFTEFLSRTGNAEALCAFIWSLLEPEADRQQYIWLYGEGGNGKSSLGIFLQQLLGNAYAAKNAANAYNNKNFTSTLIGKRLAVFEDSNYTTFVQSGTFKEVTGDGSVEVEFKYEPAYSAKLATKFMFFSNHAPEITSKAADIRRLILCHVAPITGEYDNTYNERLWAERAQILHTCKQAYDQLTVAHGKINADIVGASMLGADAELAFEAIWEEYLDAGGSITALELYKLTQGALKSHGVKLPGLKDWLLRKKNVTLKREGVNVTYSGIKAK